MSQSQKIDSTILTIESIIKESENIDTVKLPNKFGLVVNEFITMLFNYSNSVPPKQWKNLFAEGENEKFSIGWLIGSTPEFVKIHKAIDKTLAKYRIIKTYELFMRRLNKPIGSERANIFAHYVCAILVKIFYAKCKNNGKKRAMRELGDAIYNGYETFKLTESTMVNMWKKRLVVSENLARDYGLFSAFTFSQSRVLIETDDLSDSNDDDNENSDEERESQIAPSSHFTRMKFIKDSKVMSEGQSLEQRILESEEAYHIFNDEKKRLLKEIEEVKKKEKTALTEIEVLKKAHLEKNQNSYVGTAMRAIIGEGENYVDRFNEVAGFVETVMELKPIGDNLMSWVNENIKIKECSEIVFEKYRGVFEYCEPKRYVPVGSNDQNIPEAVEGWNEVDDAASDEDSEKIDEESQKDPLSLVETSFDENILNVQSSVPEGEINQNLNTETPSENPPQTKIVVNVGEPEPPTIFSSQKKHSFDMALTAPPVGSVSKKPRLAKEKVSK